MKTDESKSSMPSVFPEIPHFDAMEAGDNDPLEIEGWCSRLRQENTDLQDALGKADVEVYVLSQDITSLREKNKSLQKETSQIHDLKQQVENLRLKLKQNKDAADSEMEEQPEKLCLQMENRIDELLNELEHSEDETMELNKEVTILRNQISDLEKNLQKMRLELKEREDLAEERESIRKCMATTLSEYLSTIEVLNNRMNGIQSKVEESFREITLQKTNNESSEKHGRSLDDGTLMYEILKAKLDEERIQQKKWGFLGLMSLYIMMLKVLWCNIKVAYFTSFLILLFHYLLQLVQTQEPGFLCWCIRSVFCVDAVEAIEYILQPYVQNTGSDVVPT
ncbi:uncharacterized protein [Engystomops pustulosus]|uniref:uncharacterized protein isoform X2 n=1 Tax=Engystomops pustulosus TaxID=76066 RepID=UPI003AFAABBF